MSESWYTRLPDVYRAHGLPMRLHLDLTLRCPLRCPHCYVAERDSRASEMSTTEVGRVLEEARDLKVLFLLVSGGEPMLRPDFFEVLEAGRRLGFHLHVKTTGLYLGRAEARHLARLAPIRVDLSIHGARAVTHDRFVGMPGAFEKAVSAFKALIDAGVRVGIRTNVVTGNVDEVREIEARFGIAGVDYRKGVGLFSRRDGTRPGQDLSLDEDTCVRILTRPGAPARPRAPLDLGRPICGAGAIALYVAPDGTVMPCALWPKPLGNARRPGGLRAAFFGEAASRIRGLTHADRAECVSCSLVAICPFCPGESVAEGRSPTAMNPLACRLARIQQEVLRIRESRKNDDTDLDSP